MTFKPQQMLLTLLFLLLWTLTRRERWRLLLGFGVGMGALWLFASLFQPGWVGSFLGGVRAYSGYLQPDPVLRLPGVSGWVLMAAVGSLSLWLFARNFSAAPGSTAFAGYLVWSLGVWWLFVPVLGMLHLVALPLACCCCSPAWAASGSRLYRSGITLMFVLYGLGLMGFLYGLSPAGSYGLHIQLTELAYKLVAPLLLLMLALPLCLRDRDLLLD